MGKIDHNVQKLDQRFDTLAQENRELRAIKKRLEQMQGEKLFAFITKIDRESFQTFCAILVSGDVAKASRVLGQPESTLRSRVGTWEQRGGPYAVLLELVRWRKSERFKGTVQLDENITRATTPPTDFEGLLSDVLDGILEMNDENWEQRAEALATLLRPYVAR